MAPTRPLLVFGYLTQQSRRRAFLAPLSRPKGRFLRPPCPSIPQDAFVEHQFDGGIYMITRHATRDCLPRETRHVFCDLLHATRHTPHALILYATRDFRHATCATRHPRRDTQPPPRNLRKLTRDTRRAIREHIKTKTQHATRGLRHEREQACKTMI